MIVPGHGIGFYVAYNASEGSVAREAFTAALLEHVLPARDASASTPVAGAPGAYDALVGTYGDTRRSVSTMAKLMGLLSTFAVASEGGLLVTNLPGYGEQRWAELELLVFADVAGSGRLAFRLGERGQATHLTFSAFPETSFATTRWFDRPELHGVLFLVWIVAALSALVAWLLFGRARPVSGRASTVWSRVARRLPAAASLLFLDFAELELGVGPLLAAGLSLTLVAAALTLVSLLYAAWAWRRGTWSTVERLPYTFVALACASLTWQLHHRNLLGIRV